MNIIKNLFMNKLV